jgi:hypothetical protein
MPFGDNTLGLEDYVLSGGPKKESNKRKTQVVSALRDWQNEVKAATPGPHNPLHPERALTFLPSARGKGPLKPVVTGYNPYMEDYNTLKDTASFAKDYPGAFASATALGLIQSPVKVYGRTVEALTGDPNAQNFISSGVYDNVTGMSSGAPSAGFGRGSIRPKGSSPIGEYDAMMGRINQAMVNRSVVDSMRPDFTSDTTLGDVADTASWISPGSYVKAALAGIRGAKIGYRGLKAAEAAGRGLKAEVAARRAGTVVSRAPMSIPANPAVGSRNMGRLYTDTVFSDKYLKKSYDKLISQGASHEDAMHIIEMSTQLSRQPRTFGELNTILGT